MFKFYIREREKPSELKIHGKRNRKFFYKKNMDKKINIMYRNHLNNFVHSLVDTKERKTF